MFYLWFSAPAARLSSYFLQFLLISLKNLIPLKICSKSLIPAKSQTPPPHPPGGFDTKKQKAWLPIFPPPNLTSKTVFWPLKNPIFRSPAARIRSTRFRKSYHYIGDQWLPTLPRQQVWCLGFSVANRNRSQSRYRYRNLQSKCLVWNLKKQTTAAMTGIIFRASKKEKEVAPTKSHTWSWTQQRSRQLDGTPWKGIELDKNDKNL